MRDKIINAIILACASSLLFGCAISKQVSWPNGETLYSIDCSGTGLNMGSCLEKAGQICGKRGYEIVMSNSENQGPGAFSNQYGFLMMPMVSREIIIQCKGSASAPAGTENEPAGRPGGIGANAEKRLAQ